MALVSKNLCQATLFGRPQPLLAPDNDQRLWRERLEKTLQLLAAVIKPDGRVLPEYGMGGAINATLTSIVTLTGCRFENNQALGASWDGGGGAIHIFSGAEATITFAPDPLPDEATKEQPAANSPPGKK